MDEIGHTIKFHNNLFKPNDIAILMIADRKTTFKSNNVATSMKIAKKLSIQTIFLFITT